jgi:hypothetical protein
MPTTKKYISLTEEANDALSRLIYIGYPAKRAKKAVFKALASLPEEATHRFEKVFREAMIALR